SHDGRNTSRRRKSPPYVTGSSAGVFGATAGSVVGVGGVTAFDGSSSAAPAHADADPLAIAPVSKISLVAKRMIPPPWRHYILVPTNPVRRPRDLPPDATRPTSLRAPRQPRRVSRRYGRPGRSLRR